MTDESRATPPGQPLPRLLVWAALAAIAYLAYRAIAFLTSFVEQPLLRGERNRSFFLVQLLLITIAALLVPVLHHYVPRVRRLPRWAKWTAVLLAPLPILLFPVPQVFLATVDKWANQRELEIHRDASAPLRAALETCRKAEGRYPEDPAACLNQGNLKLNLPAGMRRLVVDYLSDGGRYALGFRGSDPARDRSAVIVFWSDGAWSWHDDQDFAVYAHRQALKQRVLSCHDTRDERWTCEGRPGQ